MTCVKLLWFGAPLSERSSRTHIQLLTRNIHMHADELNRSYGGNVATCPNRTYIYALAYLTRARPGMIEHISPGLKYWVGSMYVCEGGAFLSAHTHVTRLVWAGRVCWKKYGRCNSLGLSVGLPLSARALGFPTLQPPARCSSPPGPTSWNVTAVSAPTV